MHKSMLMLVLMLHVVILVAHDARGQVFDRSLTADDPVSQASEPECPFSHYAFSPDGQYVLAEGGWRRRPLSGDAALWKADDGSFVRNVRTFKGSPNVSSTDMDRVNRLVFDPSGALMIVARGKAPRPILGDWEIVVERTASGARVCALDMRFDVSPPVISFSDDAKYIVGCGSRVIGKPAARKGLPLDIWDAQTGRRIWDPNKPVPYPAAEFERSRHALLAELADRSLSKSAAEADLKLLFLLRSVREDGKPLLLDGTFPATALSYFSPDGAWLVTRDGILLGSDEYSSEAVIWDTARCRMVCEFIETDSRLESFIFSHDGTRFLRRAAEQPRRIYESASGKPLREFPELPSATCLALSPDGKLAVLGTRYEAVLFDTNSGQIIKSFKVPDAPPRAAQFSPDGKRLAVEFRDYSVDRLYSDEFHDRVHVYAVSDLQRVLFCLEPPPRAHRYWWYPVTYSADSTRMLYGGALWDAANGSKIRQYAVVYN